MRESHLLTAPEVDQVLGVVAARINLFEAEHGGNVGQPPGMHVEHRCDRHVDVVRAHQPRIFPTADGHRRGQGVQHQLAMGEVHAFGVTGGAGGVEGRGDRILVEVREVVARRGVGQQAFVLADAVRQANIVRIAVGEQQGLLHGGQLAGDRLVQRYELAVDQHEAVVGVVHGVEDLIRRQPHVDGVHHRADHRDGEHAFEVAMAVPVHHRHRIARLDPGRGQHVGQPRDPFVEGAVVVTQLVAVDDFPAALVAHAGQQQALDQQGILVGVRRGLDDTGLQHGGHPVLVGLVRCTLERRPPGKISPKDYFPRTSFQRVNRSRSGPGERRGRSAPPPSADRTSAPCAQSQHARGLG